MSDESNQRKGFKAMIANQVNYFTVAFDEKTVFETFDSLFHQFRRNFFEEYFIEVAIKDVNSRSHSYRFVKNEFDVEVKYDEKAIHNLLSIGKEHGQTEMYFSVKFINKELLEPKDQPPHCPRAE